MDLKRKVLAYITREIGEDSQILVFKHKDFADAGIQVPGGTIENEELLIDALYREIEEETGIERENLKLIGKVSKMKYYVDERDRVYERNFFHLELTGQAPDTWNHTVIGDGEDNGLTFSFYWVPISELPELAADQDQAIDLI